jgi:hypothetical protein
MISGLFFEQLIQWILDSTSIWHRVQILLVILLGYLVCKFSRVGSSSIKNLILKALRVDSLGEVCRLFGLL